MKRLLSLILVSIMLLTTLMLTSCDPIASVKGFVNKALGKEEETPEVRTTINEMEWRKTYSITNYTLNAEVLGEKIAIASDDKVAAMSYYGMDFIIDLSTGCFIMEGAQGYMGATLGKDVFPITNIALGEMGLLPEIAFSELVYDEEIKAYTYKDEESMLLCEFRFENGKLVYALMLPIDVTEEGKIEVTNVGTTVVELPEYIDITDGKIEPSKAGKDVVTTVTDEDLLNHLDMTNFTVSANVLIYQIGLKVTDTAVEMKATMLGEIMTEAYMAIVDGCVYEIEEEYDYDSDEYIYVATPIGDTSNSLFEELEGIEEYLSTEYLTYNEEGRYYELEVEGEKIYLYFENGNLVQFVVCTDVGLGFPMEIIFEISNVGTTKVDIPDYTIQVPELSFEPNAIGTGYIVTGIGTYVGNDVVIPESYKGLPVVEIGEGAFISNSEITSVVIPNTVKKINSYAFYGCNDLETIVLPNSLEYIGDRAFQACVNLTTIEIPASVEYVGFYAFISCNALTIHSPHASLPEGWDAEWNFNGYDSDTGEILTIPVVWEGTAPVNPHTVTQEVWNANMTITNYTATMVMPEGATGAIYQSGDVLLLDMFVEGEEVQEYEVYRDGIYYFIYKEDGEWFGRNDYLDSMPNWTTVLDLEFDKSYFSYDYDREAYISLNGSFEIVVSFENDVITSVDVNSTSGEIYLSVDFSNIGTTEEVTVPEFTIIE